MKPEADAMNPEDAASFELLEHPEAWPDDPALQAELAALLELHLALHACGAAGLAEPGETGAAEPLPAPGLQAPRAPGLQAPRAPGLQAPRAPGLQAPRAPGLQASRAPGRQPLPAGGQPVPEPLPAPFTWVLAAASLLLVALPLGYHLRTMHTLAEVARNQARIQELAQRRGQDRLWAEFFRQASVLIQDFQNQPQQCPRNRDAEDRSNDREVAFALLEASHKLTAQGSPGPHAEGLRSDLHAWLVELTLEDACLDPQRAKELRQWARTHDLEDQAQFMGRQLKGEAS